MRLFPRRRRGEPSTAPAPSAGPSDELFAFEGVRVERGGRTVLEIDHLALTDAASTAVVGPSGSGKSTLLRLCNRLDAPTSGIVRYRGRDLDAFDPLVLRQEVAMVFQQPVALDGSVADNLREGDASLTDREVELALGRVGLPEDLADRPAAQLSGGERQRLGLARSLATDPRVLLLDEATSALDPANAERIEHLVEGLVAEGIGAVWVTHDLAQVARVAAQVVVVVEGRVVQHGPVGAVFDAPHPATAAFLRSEAA